MDAGIGPRRGPGARQRVVEYVRRWLPGLEPTPRGETTCLYTSTPSEDFIIDRVGPLVVCSPCSGHGAKFAPLIGELVAGLVTGSAGVPDRFRLAAHATGRGRPDRQPLISRRSPSASSRAAGSTVSLVRT